MSKFAKHSKTKFLTRAEISAEKLYFEIQIKENRFLVSACEYDKKKFEGVIHPFQLDKVSHIEVESQPGGKVLLSLDLYEETK